MEDWKFEKMAKLSEILKTPKGFTRRENLELVEDSRPFIDSAPSISFRREDKNITVIFRIGFGFGEDKTMDVVGTTNFVSDGKGFTFDRVGIDNSFYLGENEWDKKFEEANEVLTGEIEKAEKAIIRKMDAVDVPGMPGINISLKQKEEAIERLKKGEVQTFTPSGMGVGYRICKYKTKMYSGSWARKATKVMCSFFEVPSLWVETLDCD